MKTTKSLFWLIVVVVGIIILVYIARKEIESDAIPSLSDFVASSTELSSKTGSTTDTITGISFQDGTNLDIKAPRGIVHTKVSSSEASQEKGLSGESTLPDDGGMFFEFSEVADYGFWMKDMLFSIDIVWIGEDKKVKSIDADISPDTYPDTFHSSEPVLYVMELNAGAAKKFGIQVGTQLEF